MSTIVRSWVVFGFTPEPDGFGFRGVAEIKEWCASHDEALGLVGQQRLMIVNMSGFSAMPASFDALSDAEWPNGRPAWLEACLAAGPPRLRALSSFPLKDPAGMRIVVQDELFTMPLGVERDLLLTSGFAAEAGERVTLSPTSALVA